MNSGSTFLVRDEWNPAHDYKDIGQVRDILQKIKESVSSAWTSRTRRNGKWARRDESIWKGSILHGTSSD